MTDTIAELRELLAKATAGPWVYDGCSLSDFGREWPCSMSMEWIANGSSDEDDTINAKAYHDAALIVAMRNAIEGLLDRVEAGEAALRTLATAAYEYAGNYLLDERDDPELCAMFPNCHERVVALFEAIELADSLQQKAGTP